jgi:hypothetical protein
MPKRNGFKWSINEVLRLQREYELLELTVQEIATLHDRSVNAILCKLEDEGFITNWISARGYKESDIIQPVHPTDDDTVSELSEVNKLSDRVWKLETNVSEISSLVREVLDQMKMNQMTSASSTQSTCQSTTQTPSRSSPRKSKQPSSEVSRLR